MTKNGFLLSIVLNIPLCKFAHITYGTGFQPWSYNLPVGRYQWSQFLVGCKEGHLPFPLLFFALPIHDPHQGLQKGLSLLLVSVHAAFLWLSGSLPTPLLEVSSPCWISRSVCWPGTRLQGLKTGCCEE